MVPSPLLTAVPWDGEPTEVTVKLSPSTSLSLASTFTVPGVSSSVVNTSSLATGGSFTGLTVTCTVAVAVPPFPSLTV